MQSYLAVIEDVVVQENSVGDELYMIISVSPHIRAALLCLFIANTVVVAAVPQGEVSITSKTISSVSGNSPMPP